MFCTTLVLEKCLRSRNLLAGATAVLLETLFQSRSCAKHWYKKLKPVTNNLSDYLFDLIHKRLGRNPTKNLIPFLGGLMIPKFPSEINWPLKLHLKKTMYLKPKPTNPFFHLIYQRSQFCLLSWWKTLSKWWEILPDWDSFFYYLRLKWYSFALLLDEIPYSCL